MPSASSDSSDDRDTDATRTVIRLECPACDEVDVTSQLEHPPDSAQTAAIYDAMQKLASQHADETDPSHFPDVTKEGKHGN